MAESEGIVPIAGTSNRVHLEDNMTAMELSLTPQELEQLDQSIPQGAASGERYSEAGMKTLNG
jgi:aryl-alcohol dehydrogenase-like predicted oxidoreductase